MYVVCTQRVSESVCLYVCEMGGFSQSAWRLLWKGRVPLIAHTHTHSKQ